MARKTLEEKLTEEISILDDTLYTLEQPEMGHIKEVHFNAKGEHFFTAREYDGKKFTRLDLKHVDITGGKPIPEDKYIAYKPEDGSPSTVAVYTPSEDKNTHIVKTLSKADAVKHFEALYEKRKGELQDILELKRPVVRSENNNALPKKALNTKKAA